MLKVNNVFKSVGIILLFSSSVSSGKFELEKHSKRSTPLLVTIEKYQKPVVNEKIWRLDKASISQLLTAKINESMELSNFPLISIETDETKKTTLTPISFTRYNVFAKNAKIYKINSNGRQEIQRPHLLTYSSFKHGIGFVINPKSGETQGYYNHQGVSLDIGGNIHTGITVYKLQENNVLKQCSMKMSEQPSSALENKEPPVLSRKLLQTKLGSLDYQANIAVDTDNEWMSGKGNNTTTAVNYIISLFVNMNVYFERDFATRLLIGNIILRPSSTSDPYPNEPDISNYLTDFGEYWRVNQAAVERNFALLLSGQNINSNSFSGIAWLNSYCQKGFQFGGQTAGSYSVNRIGTNISTGFVAQFVAHELGHNFGSAHTHCYNTPVDTCYNAESGCYSGAVSCPVDGSGTIMSYCHFGAPNGAACGTNNQTFHPTVIANISSLIVNNSPSCIAPFASDFIFANGFE